MADHITVYEFDALTSGAVSAPVFAWLNYRLVKTDKKHKIGMAMETLSIVGLIYLVGFAGLFVLNFTGILK